VLLPLHVVFMEMIIDPACSISFEREPAEVDVMRRQPRNPHQHLFERHLVVRSGLQGSAALLIVLAVVVGARRAGLDTVDIRTLAFTTLISTNLALILTNRSFTRTFLDAWIAPNPAMLWLIGTALSFLAVVLAVPSLRQLFQLARPHWDDLAVCAVAAVTALTLMDLIKLADLRLRRRPHDRTT
jgi:Ca2+-transporting ATPase